MMDYQLLTQIAKSWLISGKSQRALADEFGVSRYTVRKAVEIMKYIVFMATDGAEAPRLSAGSSEPLFPGRPPEWFRRMIEDVRLPWMWALLTLIGEEFWFLLAAKGEELLEALAEKVEGWKSMAERQLSFKWDG
jgi:hypothetical protein